MLPALRQHRFPARLALVAMLLLATLPTIGRLVQSNPGMHGALTAICTMQGMKFIGMQFNGMQFGGMPLDGMQPIDPGARSDPASPAKPAPDPMPHPGMDCDYCPILAATLAAVAIVLLLLPPPLRRAVPPAARRPLPDLGFLHPCGLGSRGPPPAL